MHGGDGCDGRTLAPPLALATGSGRAAGRRSEQRLRKARQEKKITTDPRRRMRSLFGI